MEQFLLDIAAQVVAGVETPPCAWGRQRAQLV